MTIEILGNAKRKKLNFAGGAIILRRVWRFPFLIFAWRTSSIPLSTALMPPIIPLAYKYVATAVMLMEINHCASNLQLPLSLPLQEQDIRKSFIPQPGLMGVGGRFDFDNYSFSFATRLGEKETKLRYIINIRHPYHSMKGGSPEMNAYLEGLTHTKSIIDTNGAYRVATNWLERCWRPPG
jgi:hypothetical protein